MFFKFQLTCIVYKSGEFCCCWKWHEPLARGRTRDNTDILSGTFVFAELIGSGPLLGIMPGCHEVEGSTSNSNFN